MDDKRINYLSQKASNVCCNDVVSVSSEPRLLQREDCEDVFNATFEAVTLLLPLDSEKQRRLKRPRTLPSKKSTPNIPDRHIYMLNIYTSFCVKMWSTEKPFCYFGQLSSETLKVYVIWMNAYIWVKNGNKDRIDIPDIHILDILTVTGSLEGVP